MTGAKDPNRKALEDVASALGEDLLGELAFLGGAAVSLLVTDEAAPPARTTKDVVCIVECATRADYFGRIRRKLQSRGFTEKVGEDVPICAWESGGIRLDVMPTGADVLGFTNRWYEEAAARADWRDLGSARIRLVQAPYFTATKLEAFHSRGEGDYYASHDIEDLIAVVNGRPSLPEEVRAASPDLQSYLSGEFEKLLASADFMNALPGLVAEPSRGKIVAERLRQIASAK